MFLGPLFKGQLLCGFGAIGKWGVKRLGCPWFHLRGKRRKALHGFGASGVRKIGHQALRGRELGDNAKFGFRPSGLAPEI